MWWFRQDKNKNGSETETNGNKVKCRVRSNGDAYVWHSHKKMRQFHSEKEEIRCSSPHKIRVMYEKKQGDL